MATIATILRYVHVDREWYVDHGSRIATNHDQSSDQPSELNRSAYWLLTGLSQAGSKKVTIRPVRKGRWEQAELIVETKGRPTKHLRTLLDELVEKYDVKSTSE
jgi:hypothetical protein